ncbi:hypothetical protein LJR098_003034 [Rhizobium sp. LjRoot98]|uniref:hypothetical protein n=1 Tax=unclassified Rhizobium TaxID=2613769 RepID=UPI0007125D3A|nr:MULTISPECIES: hypothetical protein [unclassified Rhizobium]KQV29501.1 hypothetical protein ASC96_12695 [Rhizobium sp. Root1204]KQY05420.1 hypothetical protein ASD36_13480 [Rhizobium sp. Root1334]KRC02035.1 hypothetical protein ASE23_11255 [Rhizobium sp. Root73]
MAQLSICMPSNRPWATSRSAIESALAYAEKTGALLIVSDNSRDPEKRAFLQNRSPNLLYHYSSSEDASGNGLEALSLADTPFVMPMGDDDHIQFSADETPVDLSLLPDDVVGVRPQTQIWTAENGVCQTECYTVDAASPAERLHEFTRKVMGNNSIYYSIYRTGAFVPLLRLFTQAHPTNGGYCDWSLTFALITAGRVVHDPSLIYRYDLGIWATENGIAEATSNLYVKAGLPADSEKYAALLRFLDVHVFAIRPSLRLAPAERDEVLLMNGRLALAAFLQSVRTNGADYDEVVVYLAELIEQERNIESIFHLALLMADCIKPGLKDGYIRFFKAAAAA